MSEETPREVMQKEFGDLHPADQLKALQFYIALREISSMQFRSYCKKYRQKGGVLPDVLRAINADRLSQGSLEEQQAYTQECVDLLLDYVGAMDVEEDFDPGEFLARAGLTAPAAAPAETPAEAPQPATTTPEPAEAAEPVPVADVELPKSAKTAKEAGYDFQEGQAVLVEQSNKPPLQGVITAVRNKGWQVDIELESDNTLSGVGVGYLTHYNPAPPWEGPDEMTTGTEEQAAEPVEAETHGGYAPGLHATEEGLLLVAEPAYDDFQLASQLLKRTTPVRDVEPGTSLVELIAHPIEDLGEVVVCITSGEQRPYVDLFVDRGEDAETLETQQAATFSLQGLPTIPLPDGRVLRVVLNTDYAAQEGAA